jgi:HPt (histidine-containing phosphotransfer) domain-containing protein
MTALVDVRMLTRLAALPGADGRNLATELVDSYLAQVPPNLEQIAAALAGEDLSLAHRGAHMLRGSALMLGANAFAERLQDLELKAEHGERAAATLALETVVAEWPATATALSAATAAGRDGQRAT